MRNLLGNHHRKFLMNTQQFWLTDSGFIFDLRLGEFEATPSRALIKPATCARGGRRGVYRLRRLLRRIVAPGPGREFSHPAAGGESEIDVLNGGVKLDNLFGHSPGQFQRYGRKGATRCTSICWHVCARWP